MMATSFADEETIRSTSRIRGWWPSAMLMKPVPSNSAANLNGSLNNIAGIYSSDNLKVLGLMPHPERLISPELGGSDGLALFTSVMEALA